MPLLVFAVTCSGQLHFWRGFFFTAIILLSSHFFREISSRSSGPEMFCKKNFLKTFAKFTGKNLYRSLFLSKVAGVKSTTLLKGRFRQKCFPVHFVKFLGMIFHGEHLSWLLLQFHTTVTSSEQLFLQNSYFFQSSYFFRIVHSVIF